MCTLCVAFYPKSKYPLVIAANRDENPNRIAYPWEKRIYAQKNKTSQIYVYSPIDVLGGTWIGVNSYGMFAAITNWDLDMNLHGQGMKSRGLLLLDILKTSSHNDFLEVLDISAKEYKPFNIIIGSDKLLLHVSCDHKDINLKHLEPGLHISTGLGFNTGCVREQFIRKELTKKFKDFSQPVHPDNLLELMSAHNDGIGSEDSVCVHDSEHKWETRSSAGIYYDNSCNSWNVRHIDSAPCKNPIIESWNSYTF